nr:hypothetical protein [Tanacetum cinerariifolium]
MKKVNDVTRLQALVDKKKVIITKATIRDALRLNDAEGIDCLPNEEIFTELARMGYEKPSTKLTFYMAFFSSQWKFLIHTILQCMSAKRTSWNELSSSMALAVICLSTGRKFIFSKYIFNSLVRNVDSSTKFYMLGKRCSGVETPLFEGMIVAPQAGEGAAENNVDDVPTAGVADEVAANVDTYAALTAIDEPSIPSSTLTTQPPPPSQDVPSTSQDVKISMDLLHNLLDTCTTLTRRVKNLEQDKIAQALEITKLKQRVKKLEKRNKLKVSKLKRLKKVGTSQRVETSDDIVMDDVSKQRRIIVDMDADVDVTLKDVSDIAKEVAVDAEIEESADVLSMQDDEVESDELQEVVEEITTAKLRKEKEDNAVMRYQALKRKPQTKAQARKNMMIYLRNIHGFKMDYFKGMKYDDIRLIFEKYFNLNVAFLEKTKEQMEEEDNRALKRINESQEDKVAKKQKNNLPVLILAVDGEHYCLITATWRNEGLFHVGLGYRVTWGVGGMYWYCFGEGECTGEVLNVTAVSLSFCCLVRRIDAARLMLLEGIDCLPNEEIFTELVRMGYEKPSTKLTFYMAFFSSQWKFLIHTILLCMSAKRTSWNELSSSMALAVICLSTGRKFNFFKYIFNSLVRNVDSSTKFYMYPELSSYTTKYSSPALTQKVFANTRRLGKRCSGVETPLFEGMIVAPQAGEGAAENNVDDVPAAGVADEVAANVDTYAALTAIDEP